MAGSSVLYPHLRGDLDADPALLQRLEAFAAKLGQVFDVTSGKRTYAEQSYLYEHRDTNPYPVAPPGTSRHETGKAADVEINGQPIQNVISAADLKAAGLNPLTGDAVHVELAGGNSGGGVGGALKTVGGTVVGGAVAGVPGAVAGGIAGGAATDIAGKAAGAAAGAAGDVAKAGVGLVVDAIGKDGARVLLSIALVIGGVALLVFGTARALGVRNPISKALPALAMAAAPEAAPAIAAASKSKTT